MHPRQQCRTHARLWGALCASATVADLWGGLGDVSGDSAFEYCYLEDFPRAWAVLRDHDSIDDFWTWMLEQAHPSEQTFAAVNAIAMAACYSPGPEGEPSCPSISATARCARTSGKAIEY